MARWGSALQQAAWRVEAPTWGLAVLIYGGWLALTFCWHSVPLWLAAPLGAWLCAWQMSLQHELIHGHPTRNERVNAALAAPPLNLWLPFPLYRSSHLRHHQDALLTDPLEDPETTYLSPEAWQRAGAAERWLHRAGTTLAGRMVLGPAYSIGQFWRRQAGLVASRQAPVRVWIGHAIGISLVLGWVCGVCHIGFATYAVCFVYGGTALTMIRSLAEHRAAVCPADRTAVVERAGLLGLLFLNNNLHVLHHAKPGLPWFTLPAHWRAARTGMLATHRGPVYRGYGDVARRYAVRPHHAGPHPYGLTCVPQATPTRDFGGGHEGDLAAPALG
jgi:fatty acid desaturase